MKTVMKTFVTALAFGLVVATAPVAAQDLGLDLPSKETVEAQKKARKNQVASQRVGRAIMDAFELYEQEQLQEAISLLEEELPDAEGYDRAYLSRFLGTLYAQAERTDEALPMLKNAADQDVLGWNDQAAVLKLVGQLSLQVEKYSQSVEYLKKWFEFTGEMDPQALFYVANAYYQQKEFAEIVPFAQAALKYADEPKKDYYTLLMASYFERKMYDKAIATIEEGLNVLPETIAWWPQLAQMYMLKENLPKALQTMEVAYLAGYLKEENQFKLLVQLYDNEGIPYKAATTMLKHIESGDVEGTAKNYSTAANSFHRAKELSDAAKWYGKAAELTDDRDDKGEYLRKQGNLLVQNEQYVAATTPLKNALDFAEGDDRGRIYMSLAEAFFYGGDYRQALTYVNEAAKFDNQRRSARSWKGYIQSTAKRKGVDL